MFGVGNIYLTGRAYSLYWLAQYNCNNNIQIQSYKKMRNNRPQPPIPPPQLTRHTSQTSTQLTQLRNQLRSLKQTCQQKQNSLIQINTKLRSEGLRNQKLRNQIVEVDDRTKEFIKTQVDYLFDKYKGNKESPLFYNQAGLSPFQLLKIGEDKFQIVGENHICMVCFVDLEKGSRIMKLPCTHLVHKECGIQHLLYSKQCPACSQDLK